MCGGGARELSIGSASNEATGSAKDDDKQKHGDDGEHDAGVDNYGSRHLIHEGAMAVLDGLCVGAGRSCGGLECIDTRHAALSAVRARKIGIHEVAARTALETGSLSLYAKGAQGEAAGASLRTFKSRTSVSRGAGCDNLRIIEATAFETDAIGRERNAYQPDSQYKNKCAEHLAAIERGGGDSTQKDARQVVIRPEISPIDKKLTRPSTARGGK